MEQKLSVNMNGVVRKIHILSTDGALIFCSGYGVDSSNFFNHYVCGESTRGGFTGFPVGR
jgi:hypothetical protein